AGADPDAHETERGTTAMMWAADQGHEAAIQLLIDHGADINARSDPAPRGRGPALGKANDPREQVARNGAAFTANQPTPPLGGGARAREGNDGNAAAARGGRGGRAGGAGRGGRAGGAAADAADDQDDAAAAAGIG